jgi:4'-phosphopantetheinyl transferase
MMGVPPTKPRIILRDCTSHEDPPPRSPLPAGEVHVWRCATRGSAGFLPELNAVLAQNELQRAARFRFENDRNEFVFSRGFLRRLLAGYLAASPQELVFQYTEFGRPVLDDAGGVEFNVSHSGGVVLLAFALRRRIGIDVERIRRDFSTVEIAEHFFSEEERTALRGLSEGQRHEAFFRCWTRKEAFIKALGEGLSHPLHQFDVALAAEADPIMLATRPDATEASRWELRNVAVTDGFTAALAAELP